MVLASKTMKKFVSIPLKIQHREDEVPVDDLVECRVPPATPTSCSASSQPSSVWWLSAGNGTETPAQPLREEIHDTQQG